MKAGTPHFRSALALSACTVVWAAFILALAPRALTQQQTATITGTVTDPSGAAVVGATVKVKNDQTNASQSTVTNAAGQYSIPDLSVGTYTVQASHSGFQTTVHSGVTLPVGGTVIANFTLPIGKVTETVQVTAGVSHVETQTTEVSNLVAPTQVANLPLNGRNIEQLLTLTPGVTAIAPTTNPVTGRLYGMQNNYSFSGTRPTGQMFLLDGTDVRDFWEHGIGSGYAGTELGISSISQFQVITNTASAQYAGNGVVNEVSRSGTNNFHGSAYEYFRNSALDARDINDPRSGPPPFRQNQFGGTLGGPIKKNKLFFFGNYEGLRRSLSTTSLPFGIPEPYVASGFLPCGQPGTPEVQAPFPGAPAGPNLVNTTSPVCAGLATPNATWPDVSGTPSAPGGPNPIEPVSGINPQAQQDVALYSLCTTCRPIGSFTNGISQPAGADLGGYFENVTALPLVTNEDYALGRIDYNLGPSDTMFGRYLLDDARVTNNPQDPLGIFPELDFTRNQYFTIAENHIVSPTMVNVIRFGLVRTNENSRTALGLSPGQISEASTLSGIPITSDPLDFVRTLYNEPQRPDGQFTAYLSAAVGPNPDRPDTLIDNKFSGGDDLSWTHGSHTLKAGIVVTRVQVNNVQVAYAAGETYGFANMTQTLQGVASAGFAVPPGFANSTRYFREIDIAPYFQDDWRVTPNLTLNLGLRYDYTTNPVGWAAGNLPLTVLTGSFLPPIGPQAPLPVCPTNLLAAATCSLSVYSPVKHVFAFNPNSNNWEPRFGIAWSPFGNNKTAIRAGFGVIDDPTAARIYESGYIATPPAANFFIIAPDYPNAFTPTATCVPAVTCPSPSEFAAVTYQNAYGSPYTLQYNLNIQRQITPGTILTVGYVGSVSRHLWGQRDINIPRCLTFPNCTALPAVPKSYPAPGTPGFTVDVASPGNPSPCVLPTQTTCYGSGVQFPFISILGGTVALPGERINPNFGEMVTEANTGASSYNSLQVGLNHQFSRSLSGQVNYTYSHCIDNGSFATSLEEFTQLQTDSYNQAYDYENCIFDVRHNLSVNGIYALPFGGNRFVSGWQIATILGVHSGLPINLTNNMVGVPLDPADLNTEWSSRPNYSFAPGCHPNLIEDKYIAQGVIQWFDPACYQAQANGFLGNVRRNIIPGPGTLDLDLSVIKNTKITEKVNLQFRAEAFNVMNHFNPGMPNSFINLATGQSGQVTTSQAPIVTPRQIQFALRLMF
jgi:hypothetical protein